MKKFMKGCAITALIFVVVGVALAMIAGPVSGGQRIREIVNRVTGGWLRVDIGDDIEDWGIGVGDRIWENIVGADVFYDVDEKSNLFDKSLEILTGTIDKRSLGNDIRDLDIDVGGCSFEAKKSEDDSFWLEASSIGRLQCYVKDGTLHIKSTRTGKGKVSLGMIRASKITLYVPADFTFDEVSIELGAGELSFDDLSSYEVDLEVGAGQIQMKNLKADEMDVQVGMGEIVMQNMQAGTLQAEVGMGNLEMEGAISKGADLECAMGNIDLKIDGAKEDFDYTLECSMGNIYMDGDEFSGLSQKRQISNGANKNMDIECSMGNIDISFR
ncbi:MAG: DUF4097 domain-containing protein [Roseburia sp.]|nr:DUF4097 domain-containing protein [Roseburia sp.]